MTEPTEGAVAARDREWSAALVGSPFGDDWMHEKMTDPEFAAGFFKELVKVSKESAAEAMREKLAAVEAERDRLREVVQLLADIVGDKDEIAVVLKEPYPRLIRAALGD